MELVDLHKDFIKQIVRHDYSYMYSDSGNTYQRGRNQLIQIENDLEQLINTFKMDAGDLLDECIKAREEQYKDGLTHSVIRSLFRKYLHK